MLQNYTFLVTENYKNSPREKLHIEQTMNQIIDIMKN